MGVNFGLVVDWFYGCVPRTSKSLGKLTVISHTAVPVASVITADTGMLLLYKVSVKPAWLSAK